MRCFGNIKPGHSYHFLLYCAAGAGYTNLQKIGIVPAEALPEFRSQLRLFSLF